MKAPSLSSQIFNLVELLCFSSLGIRYRSTHSVVEQHRCQLKEVPSYGQVTCDKALTERVLGRSTEPAMQTGPISGNFIRSARGQSRRGWQDGPPGGLLLPSALAAKPASWSRP